MATIRALRQEDLPGVAGLLARHLPNPEWDEKRLAEALLAEADPDLPSLVAEADGDLVGFVAVETRRFTFDGREIRAVCCSNLVVAPDARAGAAGALLLRRMLAGPQDLTFSDTASPLVERIWFALGGHRDAARGSNWFVVLRPLQWAGTGALLALRRRGELRRHVPVPALSPQAVGPRLLRRAFPAPPADLTGEDVGAAALAEALPGLLRGMRVHPTYGAEELEALFAQFEGRPDPVVRRLVRQKGQPIGWYAYILRAGGTSVVLNVAGAPPRIETVLAELVADAERRGSTALAGRLEPHLQVALRDRRPALFFRPGSVLHARDPALDAALATEASLLTRLEGEWHLEMTAPGAPAPGSG